MYSATSSVSDWGMMMGDREQLRRSKSHRRAGVQKLGRTLQLMFNNNAITPTAALKQVPNYSIIDLIVLVSLEWRINVRYKLMCDKRYIVRCHTSNTLSEIKQQFWDVYRAVENEMAGDCHINSMWLTQHDKLITDAVLKESFDSITNGSKSVDTILQLSQRRAALHLGYFSGEQGSSGLLYIDDVFVHFQSKNAVPVSIVFKDKADKSSSEFSTTTVVCSELGAKDLREEVSKVVRYQANSIRILIGSTKLQRNTDLSKELSTPGCKIVVKPKAKITLTVYVSTVPLSEAETTQFDFAVYSYDTLKSLKKQVSFTTGVPHQYQIDLLFEGRLLDENNTFSELRIKDKDALEARVYVNRLMIPVRMPNRRIYDLLVDDCKSFTVGHMKAFARTVDGVEPFHNCEVSAILKDRVVADNDILGDIMADVGHGVKLVLARTESECFTVATAFEGTLRVFKLSSDGSHFQHILGMSNGKRLLCDPNISTEDEEFVSLVQNRRQAEQFPPGIKIMPHHDDLSELRGHRYKSITSRFSSPTPSVSSMTTMHPNDNWKSRASPKVGECKEQELPKLSPIRERPSSVRFYTGNSDGDPASAFNQLEEDGSVSALISQNEEDQSNEQTASKRQSSKPRTFKTKKTMGEGYDGGRSRSCPTVQSLWPASEKGQLANVCWSDSESGLSRKTQLSEDLFKNPDGSYTYLRATTSKARFTPDLVKQMFNFNTVPSNFPHSMNTVSRVPPVQDQQCQALASQPDTAYKYVKERVIWFLANNLGAQGNKFIRALEVPQNEIDDATHKHPSEQSEKYFCLLRCWLKRSGSKATIEALVEALVSIGHNDYVEKIKELNLEPAAPEPSSSEQASSPDTPERPGPDIDSMD